MHIHILKAVAVLLACITIGSNFGKLHFVLDTLSHFRVQYAALFLLVGLLFSIFRQAAWLALSVIGMVANLASIVPWYLEKNEWLSADSGHSFKILASNVYLHSKNYESLAKLVDEEQPEILGLFEVDSNWIVALASLRNEYKFRFVYPQDDHQGIALFSKLPITESNVVWFGESATPAIVASIKAGNEVFELILAHPPPPMSAGLAATRNTQLQEIARYVRASDKAIVLAGDLNTTMWSPYYNEFVEASGLINARTGYGIGATWVTRSPFGIPIDHIMVSSPSRVGDFRVHKRIGSDHRPISAHIRIVPQNEGEMSGAALAH